MNVIRGGKGEQGFGGGEAFVTDEHGQLIDVMLKVESDTGRSVAELFDILNIEQYYGDKVQNALNRAAYRVTDGESVASDLEMSFTGNLVDQLAQLRGIDCVKIHHSVYEAVEKTAEHRALPEGTDKQKVTWAWETGRFIGRSLQRNVDAHIAPLSIPATFGIVTFFDKVAHDMFGEQFDFHIPVERDIDVAALQDYKQQALPERIASAMGNIFVQYFYEVDDEFMDSFSRELRDKVIRPYHLAHNFGTEFRPDISYRELAATHPLDNGELTNYLEYISEPSDTIYLHER